MGGDHLADGDHDFVVCADVLGAFGVSSEHVRRRADRDAISVETAISIALESAGHPTEYLRRTICASSRGVDVPARYRQGRFWDELAAVFETLEWDLSVDRGQGRTTELTVTDGTGSTREVSVSYPETALGNHNAPAIVYQVNARLLYDLQCEFVLLSDGTDRWQLALVETEGLDRLREQFGERLEVFARAFLPASQPAAYVPDESDGSVPLPTWAVDDTSAGSGFGRRSWDVGNGGSSSPASKAEEPVGSSGGKGRNTTAEDRDPSDVIDFVSETGEGDSSTTAESDPARTVHSGDRSKTTSRSGKQSAEDRSESADGFESISGWSSATSMKGDENLSRMGRSGADSGRSEGESTIEDIEENRARQTAADERVASDSSLETEGFEVGGSPTTVSKSSDDRVDPLDVAREGAETGSHADGSPKSAPSLTRESSQLPPDSKLESPSSEESTATDQYGFEVGTRDSLADGASTVRVDSDSFGVDAGEFDEESEIRAYGAAMTAPADLSVKGLLADDDFVPEFPASGPEEVRIEYEDEFEPAPPSPADTRETDNGFVWVNEDSLGSS